MKQNTSLGTNKTGIDMSPVLSKAMIEGAQQFMTRGNKGRTNGNGAVRMDDPAMSESQWIWASRTWGRNSSAH